MEPCRVKLVFLMQVDALREYSDRDLLPLFEDEAKAWRDQLAWDYRPTQEVIRRFVASQTLPGFVLNDGFRPVGYSYFVVDGSVAFIGGLFIEQQFSSEENYRLVVERTVKTLTGLGRVKRIESQVFGFNRELRPIFRDLGFETPKRLFLESILEFPTELTPNPAAVGSFQIVPWKRCYLFPIAEVVYDSYRSSGDAEICSDYKTKNGCLRFLRNLIDNPSCGVFSPELTLVAQDGRDRLCGLLLATRIGKTTGMIPQLSIRRDCQGKGLGKRLLATYMKQAREEGLETVTLSVTESNSGASRLYRRCGFQVRKEFHAFVWQRR